MDDELMEIKRNLPLKYEKRNDFVTAGYNMSKTEQKIVAYALAVIRGKKFSEEEKKMGITVVFPAKEIREALVTSSERHSIYDDLKRISTGIQSKSIYIETKDESDKKNFSIFRLIKTCTYKNGFFSIQFHEMASPMITGLDVQGGFAVFDLPIVMALESNYTIRFYEMIKSKAYMMKNGYYEFTEDLVKLKIMLGVIDEDNDKVKLLVAKYSNDSAKLQEKIDEIDEGMSLSDKRKKRQVHKYKVWYEFKREVLDVAKNEMLGGLDSGLYDLVFDYEAITVKRKVIGVKIKIYEGTLYRRIQKKEPHQMTIFDVENDNEQDTRTCDYNSVIKMVDEKGVYKFFSEYDDYKYEIPENITPIIEERFKVLILQVVGELFKTSINGATAKNIAEAGGYDLERIFHNIEYALGNKAKIKDINAYIVDACRKDYANGEKPKKSKGANDFCNFEQRDYDFDKLEKELLAN